MSLEFRQKWDEQTELGTTKIARNWRKFLERRKPQRGNPDSAHNSFRFLDVIWTCVYRGRIQEQRKQYTGGRDFSTGSRKTRVSKSSSFRLVLSTVGFPLTPWSGYILQVRPRLGTIYLTSKNKTKMYPL